MIYSICNSIKLTNPVFLSSISSSIHLTIHKPIPEIGPILTLNWKNSGKNMLSKIYLLNRSALPILAKGSLCSSYNNVQSLKRNYRVRTFVYEQSTMEQSPAVSQSDAKTPLSTEEQKPVEEANEIQNAAVYQSDTTSVNYTDICEKQLLQDNNRSPYSDLARESDNIYRRISGQEELHEIPSVGKENVSVLSFEDEYFRLKDEATHRFLEDDVDDTLDRANSCHPDEEVMFVKQDDAGAFFDRILSMDENEVLTEREKKLISIIREEKKAEKKDIKRNTWFNFMPAKEKPEGMFGTYSPDQIFSSLVFDLLSRNANEVYKYEKDDMFLNEVSSI